MSDYVSAQHDADKKGRRLYKLTADGEGGGDVASVSDLVAALREEGGEIVERCEEHKADLMADSEECGVAYWMGPNYQPDCRIVSVLVVRIDGEET